MDSDEFVEWEDDSYDDPHCECAFLDNHALCPVHGVDFRTNQWRKPTDYKPNHPTKERDVTTQND